MDVAALLTELLGRVDGHVHGLLDDLDPAWLTRAPADGANTIAWLVWHLTRVEDHHVGELLDEPQLWVTGDYAAGFGLDPDPDNSGYGHGPAEVAAVAPTSTEPVQAYRDAVAARTRAYLEGLSPADLDRIVDERWDPPVTLGVRLVSIVDDAIQHAGQAAYVKGLLERG
jgi:uncharacterized damage-inducible protein DinB